METQYGLDQKISLSISAGHWRQYLHKIRSLWAALRLGLYLFTEYQNGLTLNKWPVKQNSAAVCWVVAGIKIKAAKMISKTVLRPTQSEATRKSRVWGNLMRKMSLCKVQDNLSEQDESSSAHLLIKALSSWRSYAVLTVQFLWLYRHKHWRKVIYKLCFFLVAHNWSWICFSSSLWERGGKNRQVKGPELVTQSSDNLD